MMYDHHTISVIVPVYNTEKHLRKCLDSICAQTYSNLEIILVDDGSSDGCPAICDEYAAGDDRIRVIHKPNGGVSSARNAALDVVTGEYIGFVDSDDWIEPGMYELLHRNLVENTADISVCGFFRDEEDGEPNADDASDTLVELSAIEARKEMYAGRLFGGHMWDKLFCAEKIQNVKFAEDVSFCEDTMACGLILEQCDKVVFTPKKEYHYVMREASAVHTVHDVDLSVYVACSSLYEQMKRVSPGHLYYAEYFCLFSSICVARRIYWGNNLSKDIFQRIRTEVIEHLSPGAFDLLCTQDRVWILSIVTGRWAYVLCRKIKDVFSPAN